MSTRAIEGVGHGQAFVPVKDEFGPVLTQLGDGTIMERVSPPPSFRPDPADVKHDITEAGKELLSRSNNPGPGPDGPGSWSAQPQHHSAGKPKFGLVPPRALLCMAQVMTDAESTLGPDGKPKYTPQPNGQPNYLAGKGLNPQEYIESALRHVNAANRGEVYNDTGLPHLAHAAIDAAIALELMYHQGTIPQVIK